MPAPFSQRQTIDVTQIENDVETNKQNITECALLNDTSQSIKANSTTSTTVYAGHSNTVYTAIEDTKITIQAGEVTTGEGDYGGSHVAKIEYNNNWPQFGLAISSEHVDYDSLLTMRADRLELATHSSAVFPQIAITGGLVKEVIINANAKLMHGNLAIGSFIELDNAYFTDLCRIFSTADGDAYGGSGEYDDDGVAGGNKLATPRTDGFPEDINDWFYFHRWRSINGGQKAVCPYPNDYIVKNESNTTLVGSTYEDGTKIEITTAGYYRLDANIFIHMVNQTKQQIAYSFSKDDANDEKARIGPVALTVRESTSDLLDCQSTSLTHVLYCSSGDRVSLIYAKASHARVEFSSSSGQADAPAGVSQLRVTYLMP